MSEDHTNHQSKRKKVVGLDERVRRLIDRGYWGRLTGAEAKVAAVIIRHANFNTGRSWVGGPSMGKRLDMDPTNVSRAITGLIKKKVIKRLPKKKWTEKGYVNIYKIRCKKPLPDNASRLVTNDKSSQGDMSPVTSHPAPDLSKSRDDLSKSGRRLVTKDNHTHLEPTRKKNRVGVGTMTSSVGGRVGGTSGTPAELRRAIENFEDNEARIDHFIRWTHPARAWAIARQLKYKASKSDDGEVKESDVEFFLEHPNEVVLLPSERDSVFAAEAASRSKNDPEPPRTRQERSLGHAKGHGGQGDDEDDQGGVDTGDDEGDEGDEDDGIYSGEQFAIMADEREVRGKKSR